MNAKLKGLDKLIDGLKCFPKEIALGMANAGVEAGTKYVIEQDGVGKYPAATAANQPPPPYYIRGTGMVNGSGRVISASETLGKQFYATPGPSVGRGFQVTVGNRARYAGYVVGEKQAGAMARIGWRRMLDVAQENIVKIGQVYQAEINRLIQKLGL